MFLFLFLFYLFFSYQPSLGSVGATVASRACNTLLICFNRGRHSRCLMESWCVSEPKWLRLNQKISKIYCVIIYNSFFHRIQESNQNQKISNICRSKSQNLIFRFLNAILISMKKCRSESQNSDCSMKKFWRCFIGVSDAAVGWLTTLLLHRSPLTANDAAVGWESDFSKGELPRC